jgi:5-methyltetrahydrofolate--homocysteine methyltransferase
MTIQQDIFTTVVNGDSTSTDWLVRDALAAGIPARELLEDVLIPAMAEVGARFAAGDYYVSEMLVSAQAMKTALRHLRPLLTAAAVEPIGTVVIGTVKGDLHDIGKNLVAMMLEGAGFQVIDLGVDVPVDRFVRAAEENGADLLALSALLTTTMLNMRTVVTALKAKGLDSRVKVIIGGAPVTQEFADQIGADGFAPDAAAAAVWARQLFAEREAAR